MKECNICNIEKELTEFSPRSDRSGAYRGSCKPCLLIRNKEWKRLNPVKAKTHLVKKYGITGEEYNSMFANQEGKCKICDIHQSDLKVSLHVDHCHSTNKVRGLLCTNCNRGIGHLQDSVNILAAAIKYLEE